MKLIATYEEKIPFKDTIYVEVEVIHVSGPWAMVRKEKYVPFVVATKKLSGFETK